MVKQGMPEREKSTIEFDLEGVDAHQGGAGDFGDHGAIRSCVLIGGLCPRSPCSGLCVNL
jgi:hypothetical protein